MNQNHSLHPVSSFSCSCCFFFGSFYSSSPNKKFQKGPTAFIVNNLMHLIWNKIVPRFAQFPAGRLNSSWASVSCFTQLHLLVPLCLKCSTGLLTSCCFQQGWTLIKLSGLRVCLVSSVTYSSCDISRGYCEKAAWSSEHKCASAGFN